jgi:hypothetical protein
MKIGRTIEGAILLSAVTAALSVGVMRATPPLARPESMAGAWETTTPSGTHGMFLHISTHARGPAERQTITERTADIRLYHRTAGREGGGWYRDGRFDGERLRVAGLDVAFDADRLRWSGTFTIDGEARSVLLERPRPPAGSGSCPVCGDWERVPESTPFSTPTWLHIMQSSDGALTAWMDRILGVVDQRHGEPLEVLSADSSQVTLALVSAGSNARFNGRLSDDGSTLSGRWDNGAGSYRLGPESYTLNAAVNFRRLR